MIRMKKIRDSARNQPCTINAPCCSYNNEETVFAHYGETGEKGMGLKPGDHSGFYSCAACHDWIDGRTQLKHSYPNDPDKEWYCFRAMRRTWKLLLENEVLK